MNEGEDKPAGKVLPFTKTIQGALAEELRRMYAGLVRERLPDDLSTLLQQFEELTKKDPGEQS